MNVEVTIRDVMTREYVGVSESDTVESVVRVLREEAAHSALVLRGSDPIGIVTEYDVMGLVVDGSDPAETTAGDIMSGPVLSVHPTTLLTDAAETMSRENIRTLIVEDDEDEIVGVLTGRDIIAATASLQRTAPTDPNALDESAVGQPATGGATATASSEYGQEPIDAEYAEQGICESCGRLTESLFDANGQLVCADCRDV